MGDGGTPAPMNGWNYIRLVYALRRVSVSISSEDMLDAQVCLDRFPNIPDKQILKSLFIRRPQDLTIFETIWRILYDAQEAVQDDVEEGTAIAVLDEDQDSFGIGGQGVGHGSGGISLTSKGHLPGHFTHN